jgi:hypothetical protein
MRRRERDMTSLDRPQSESIDEYRDTLDVTQREAEGAGGQPGAAAGRVEGEVGTSTRGVRDAEGAADRASGRALERPQADSIEEHRATLDVDEDGIEGDVE